MTMTAAAVCLYVIFSGVCIGTVASILVVFTQFLYQLPYTVWAGFTGADTRYPAIKDCSFFKSTVNATRLYKHWIFHKKLDF